MNQPREAAEADAHHVGDPLEAAERRDLAEHPVAVRLRVAGEVLRQPPRLAERVLAGRRIDAAGGAGVRHGGAVAERPDVVEPLDPQRRVDAHAAALVERQAEPRELGARLDAGRPDERVREHRGTVRERCRAGVDGLQGRVDVDLDAPFDELARRVFAEPRRDLGEDLGRRVDEHPALRDLAQARVPAKRVLDEVGELCERLDAGVARADEHEAELRALRPAGGRRLELAQDVVAKGDAVGEILEAEAVLGEAGAPGRPRLTAPSATTSCS